MKYSANQGRISSFVVGRAGSEYGLPVAVYKNYTIVQVLNKPDKISIPWDDKACRPFSQNRLQKLLQGVLPLKFMFTSLKTSHHNPTDKNISLIWIKFYHILGKIFGQHPIFAYFYLLHSYAMQSPIGNMGHWSNKYIPLSIFTTPAQTAWTKGF